MSFGIKKALTESSLCHSKTWSKQEFLQVSEKIRQKVSLECLKLESKTYQPKKTRWI